MSLLWRNDSLCSVSVCHFAYKFLFRHSDGKKIFPLRTREKKKNLHGRFHTFELILYLILISKINFSVFHSTLSSSINVEY